MRFRGGNMERLYKMKNSNPDENVYIIGPMYLKNGLTTAVVVTLPKTQVKSISYLLRKMSNA